MIPRRTHLLLAGLLLAILPPSAHAADAAPESPPEVQLAPAPIWLGADAYPGSPNKAAPNPRAISIDPSSRAAVVQAWYTVYQPALQVAAGWTGSTSGCNAGVTAAAYKQATIDLVNYYRAMTGLPGNVTLDSSLEAKCQQAALMMLANNSLSHTPPTNWSCYTAGGAEAAGKSNIALGGGGPYAITMYMDDFGGNNTAVGHRRWILYPPQAAIGTGSTKLATGWGASNDLWVIGTAGARPATPTHVAWPPPGYVPYPLLYDRWSLSRQGADFSQCTITMRRGAQTLALTKLTIANGYGDNTVVWEPQDVPSSAPAADTPYEVQVSGIKVGSTTYTHSYTVVAIDPAVTPQPPQSAARNWQSFE